MRCPRQLHQNLLLHLLNSWWLQFARSARVQSNRWIITFTASPAWAWPTPRRCWTSPPADIARTYRSACSGHAAMWFAAYSGWCSLPPACRWWAPPLLAAGAPSCRAAEPNGRPIPRFPFPRTISAPLPTSRGLYPFGHEEGDDAMSISASEKEDWAGSEPDQLDSSEPSDLQEELMRVLSKAVQELELTWSPPEEPVRSKLDS